MIRDPNGDCILVNHDGLAIYGRLTQATLRRMTRAQIAQFTREVSVPHTSIADMRAHACEILVGMGFEGVVWPLDALDRYKIKSGGKIPRGALLTKIDVAHAVEVPEAQA